MALALACFLIAAPAPAREGGAPVAFDIRAQKLVDALNVFAEQSGLQVVYEDAQLEQLITPEVVGTMPPEQALRRLLEAAPIEWRTIGSHTVVVRLSAAAPRAVASETERRGSAMETIVVLSRAERSAAEARSDVVSDSAFGFGKTLSETPRSISVIDGNTIDLFRVASVEDMARLVPGTYTTTRFGIQGGIDIRSSPADTFFRGMKRLNLQGHAPSVLSAMDKIEVVRGPPSPIYGMSRIGGYTNMVPRSARAEQGRYLDHPQLVTQARYGSYQQKQATLGYGGPASVAGRPVGYYLYGFFENSGSYAEDVPLESLLLQAAFSVERFAGPLRLETGVTVQRSRTSGAMINRVTQSLVDEGRYVRGTPLIDLDLDGGGAISYREIHQASAARGTLAAGNQPLRQYWSWPVDADGRRLPLGRAFPATAGIPQSMYDYLQLHPDKDPGGWLRSAGAGGPLPLSGYVPAGFVFDPTTIGYDQLNLRRAAAYERDLLARFATAYVDLIYDDDPSLRFKNQLFFDGMDQYKSSNQPFGDVQQPWVAEEKFTLMLKPQRVPSWVELEALGALNFRYTDSLSHICAGDFSNSRTDAMAPTWRAATGGMTPNTTFVNCVENSDIDAGGYPYTSTGRTKYSQLGAGLLFDLQFASGTDVLLGARWDGSTARNTETGEAYNVNTGTSAAPGAPTARVSGKGWDSGLSWSASISQELGFGIRPYLSFADASVILDNNANRITNDVIRRGHIGRSQLREIGIKSAALGGHLLFSAAAYEQRRSDVARLSDPSLSADVASTVTRGWESELKWQTARSMLSFYATRQSVTFNPNRGGTMMIDARALGFQDVVDADGAIIYPAEAFLYGGQSMIVLPDGMRGYRYRQGTPDFQIGLNASHLFKSGLGVSGGLQYLSDFYAGRLKLIQLPSALVVNAGLRYERGPALLRFDVFNLTDERYFRARNTDSYTDYPLTAMPRRNFSISIQLDF